MSPPQHVRKHAPDKAGRLRRLIGSVCDPRAWLHLIKIVNFYNYTHVAQLRRLQLGNGANISPDAVFANAENIVIGERVRIGSRCHIWAGPASGTIVLGDDVLLGPDVMITAASYDYHGGSPVTDQPMKESNIVIGNDVWLATRVVILPGTTIGDGAIIAAGSVVKGNIPAFAIAAGSPARVVSQRQSG